MLCPECGSLMRPTKKGGKIVFVCPNCGHEARPGAGAGFSVTSKVVSDPAEKPVIIDNPDELISLPKVKVICPNCGNTEAWLRIEQTRSADEPPTRIYTCVKCKYTWREYS